MSFAVIVSRLKLRPAVWLALTLPCVALPREAAAQTASQAAPIAARSKGSATAPVTVYEMADFQCPYCGTFARDIMPTLEKEYVATGKVRWVFINLPIPSLHANAMAAAEFASCASKQGRFWQAHDMLYGNQDQWEKLKNPVPYFQSKLGTLGLKADAMNSCLQSGAGAAMVRDDMAGADRAGAHSTPAFYIEGGMMEGAQPATVFRPILDSIIRAKSAAKKP